jgi:hypothetical protein
MDTRPGAGASVGTGSRGRPLAQRPGRLLAPWPARPPGGSSQTTRILNGSGPGVCAGALGAGVDGGLNAGEPRP